MDTTRDTAGPGPLGGHELQCSTVAQSRLRLLRMYSVYSVYSSFAVVCCRLLSFAVVCCRLLSGCSSLWKCQSLDAESSAIYLEDCAAITTI